MRDFTFSLRAKTLLLVGCVFAAWVGTIGYHAVNEREMRLAAVRKDLRQDAMLAAERQHKVIEGAERFLESLVAAQGRRIQAERPTIFSEGECERIVAQRMHERPDLANIIAVRPDGSLVCSAMPVAGWVNLRDRPSFQQALKSEAAVIGEVIESPIHGKLVLPIIHSVYDSGGRALGLIGISLDVAALAETASGAYPEYARFGVVDSRGMVLAKMNDVEKVVGKDVSATSFFKAIQAHGDEATFETIGFDGVPRLYGVGRFATSASGPIWFWYSVAKKEVTADVERDFLWSVAVLIGVLLATFAAVWAGGERLLLRPVSALSTAARRLGGGDLSARTGMKYARDELGALARTFDEVAASLQAKDQHIVLAERALKVLSMWNQALLAPRDEQSLAEAMCRSIVEAGYRGAGVGYARFDEKRTVEPVASWGIGPEFIAGLDVVWMDAPGGRGPSGAAIRRGATVVMNDYSTNPDTAPRHEFARRQGLNSIISIPLRVDDAVIGALSVYAAESEAFGEQEAVLLAEVAAALASGIGALRSRAARTRLEASLQSSEERFRAAAEASLDALFVLKSVRDANGNIADFEFTDLNHRAARWLGLAKEEVLGKTSFELLPVHGRTALFERYVRVVETRTSLEEEFPFDAPGAERQWFRQQVVAVGDGVAVTLRHITVWKVAGDKVREAEERLRLAMAGAQMAAWGVDSRSGAYAVSEEWGPLFGLPRGAGPLTTEALLQAVHPEDRKALADAIQRDLDTAQGSQHKEYRVLWPDGTARWLESHSSVICDEAGRPVRRVGVLADITQRKLDTLALQRANRALRTLLAGNEALVRASSESELLREVCSVVVDKGGYRLAAVGYPQSDRGKTIATVALAGAEKENYPAGSWADDERGQRPIARALRGGKTELVRDVRSDPAFAFVRASLPSERYASNLALPLREGDRVFGALSIVAAEADAFDEAEVQLLQELAANLAYGITTLRTRQERDRIAHAHEHHAEILRKSLEDSVEVIAATVERRDPYTAGHQKRVAEFASALAREMGMPEEQIRGLRLASIVHDLGKISVPADILAKPKKLTPVELELVRDHARAGYEILKGIDFPWPIATIVWQHHERFDGSGYPQGLKGEELLLESRILAVADVLEAMASHRPYRASLGIDAALQEIERGRGIRYDPAVADACLKLFREGGYMLAASAFHA